MNIYIQYTVKGLNTNINGNTISLSYMKTSTPVPFHDVQVDVYTSFIHIKENTDVISFINKYGNIFKEQNISFNEVKNEAKILRNLVRMITILKKPKEAYDLMENIKKLNLHFLNTIIQKYMEQLGKLDEYNKFYFLKDDKYKAGYAIKELLYVIDNNYEIDKDDSDEYVFIGLNGIPIYNLKQDVYYILNTLFARILSHITLQTYYIEEEHTFRNIQKVNTLLEALYLYTYNRLDTDNPIRVCSNPNCDEIIISENKRKSFCSDTCRNRYNKNKNSNNPIELCINRYRQRAYRAYTNNIIDQFTQEQICQSLLETRDKLIKNNIPDIKIYEERFSKIIKQYIK